MIKLLTFSMTHLPMPSTNHITVNSKKSLLDSLIILVGISYLKVSMLYRLRYSAVTFAVKSFWDFFT